MNLELGVFPERTQLSASSHRIEFVKDGEPRLVVQLPWPVLVDGIKLSLIGPKNNTIQVKMKKCFDHPWLDEFGGRSKWDVNLMPPWKDVPGHGTLEDHIKAQFDCADLFLAKKCMKNTASPVWALNEVREIMRSIFYSHNNNSFNLFTVHDHLNPQEAVLHLRIHPPVRFSPNGSPLLIVSCFDHQLANRLNSQDQLNAEQSESDFQRLLILDEVSREVCDITTKATEELNLLRYLLRVNSTRMRRSAWQSKNLQEESSGEMSPWIATFISPLYVEVITNSCKQQTPFAQTNSPFYQLDAKCCASCNVKKIPLKTCTRCRRVYFCSVSCQKKHWVIHKAHC